MDFLNLKIVDKLKIKSLKHNHKKGKIILNDWECNFLKTFKESVFIEQEITLKQKDKIDEIYQQHRFLI